MKARKLSPYKVQTDFSVFRINGLIPLVRGDKYFSSNKTVVRKSFELIFRKSRIFTRIQRQFRMTSPDSPGCPLALGCLFVFKRAISLPIGYRDPSLEASSRLAVLTGLHSRGSNPRHSSFNQHIRRMISIWKINLQRAIHSSKRIRKNRNLSGQNLFSPTSSK